MICHKTYVTYHIEKRHLYEYISVIPMVVVWHIMVARWSRSPYMSFSTSDPVSTGMGDRSQFQFCRTILVFNQLPKLTQPGPSMDRQKVLTDILPCTRQFAQKRI